MSEPKDVQELLDIRPRIGVKETAELLRINRELERQDIHEVKLLMEHVGACHDWLLRLLQALEAHELLHHKEMNDRQQLEAMAGERAREAAYLVEDLCETIWVAKAVSGDSP